MMGTSVHVTYAGLGLDVTGTYYPKSIGTGTESDDNPCFTIETIVMGSYNMLEFFNKLGEIYSKQTQVQLPYPHHTAVMWISPIDEIESLCVDILMNSSPED